MAESGDWRLASKKMIYWLGRQWMVTGLGIETVKGNHRIPVSEIRALDEQGRGWLERMHEQAWVQIEDFSEALSVARARWPAMPAHDAFYFPPVETKFDAGNA